jgi:hypothetical protein
VHLKGAHMVKNPKQREELFARRERQRVEGAVAMKEYLANAEATRRKTKRLREQRLAQQSAEQQSANAK